MANASGIVSFHKPGQTWPRCTKTDRRQYHHLVAHRPRRATLHPARRTFTTPTMSCGAWWNCCNGPGGPGFRDFGFVGASLGPYRATMDLVGNQHGHGVAFSRGINASARVHRVRAFLVLGLLQRLSRFNPWCGKEFSKRGKGERTEPQLGENGLPSEYGNRTWTRGFLFPMRGQQPAHSPTAG